MVNGTNQTSTQGAVESANPLDLVNKDTTQNDIQPGTKHNGIIDNIVGLIAKITGNPDPFTGKGNIATTSKPEANVVTQTATPEFKPENQTVTSPVKDEEGGLFGKFGFTLTNIGNAVENLGNKAVGEATNVVNKGLETAGTVGEKVVDKTQQVVKQASDNVNEFVKLEEPKKEGNANNQK